MANHADLRVNRLLSLLPEDELARIAPALSVLDCEHHDLIYGVGAEVRFAFFPLTAVMSLIASDSHGHAVEAASVGREGLVGLPGALGGGGMVGEVITQVSGRVARIEVGALRAEIERRGTLSIVVERYTVALLSQISQVVLCNRHHSLESRAARWLLATGDRHGEDEFLLTQDFLGVMLGVARPQVTLAEVALKQAGLIGYRRGRMTILDRAGLEATVCECYGTIKGEFERLLWRTNGDGLGAVGG
jgi:CRP-like cAMP-binding protein